MEKDDRAPKIYTRTGDKGKTSLIGGTRVPKSHLRLDAYGTVDELNCVLGILKIELSGDLTRGSAEFKAKGPELEAILFEIQNDLFNVGSQLACEDDAFRSKLPGIPAEKIQKLEALMDQYSAELKPLKNFILPGGSRSAAYTHLARTVCRRAERACVILVENSESVDANIIPYINRLSDYFFVLSRYLNHLQSVNEPVWKP